MKKESKLEIIEDFDECGCEHLNELCAEMAKELFYLNNVQIYQVSSETPSAIKNKLLLWFVREK